MKKTLSLRLFLIHWHSNFGGIFNFISGARKMMKADITEKGEEPLYCLSFSPNWNTYQILSINTSGLLAYGSNAESFLIDVPNKNFLSSVKPSENIPNSQLKVTSMLLGESFLFVGFSHGFIYAFNHKLGNEVFFKTKASEKPIMHIIHRQSIKESLHLLLIDSEGVVYELAYLAGIAKAFPIKIECQSQVVKCNEYFYPELKKSLLLTITQKGIVSIWDLENKSEIITYNTNSPIYKADCILEDETTLTCGLVAKKDMLAVIRFNLKTILENSETTQKFKASSTKLVFQLQAKDKGDPEVMASKPHIMFLNREKVLISGKTGELFLVPMKTLEEKQELELKHLSAMGDEEPLFEVLERNPHYKQIYAMEKYVHQQTTILLTLGIDRKLSFWRYEEDEIQHFWTINFLGGKVRKIVTSELEKNKVFLTCIDKTIRVWDLEKKNNKFSTQEIWKQLSHTPIVHLALHPDLEGICAYSTEDAKICMYDILNQVCFKVLKLEKEIRLIQWISKKYYPYFVRFMNAKSPDFPDIPMIQEESKDDREEGEEEKINVKYGFQKTSDPKFTKSLTEDYMLMGILQEGHVMFLGVNDIIEFYRAETLHNQDSFGYIVLDTSEKATCLLIGTGSKDGKCSFWKVDATKAELICSYKFNVYHISSVKFHKLKDGTILFATSSHDRKIIVYEVLIGTDPSYADIKIKTRLSFKHKNRVNELKWSIGSSLLAVAHQDRTVQVWDCSLSLEDKESTSEFLPAKNSREVCNIRGHDGYITDATFSLYDENTIITASDDQTVKVWNINKISYKSIPNAKKKNKKKKNKNKPSSLEDEEPEIQKKVKLETKADETNEKPDEKETEKSV